MNELGAQILDFVSKNAIFVVVGFYFIIPRPFMTTYLPTIINHYDTVTRRLLILELLEHIYQKFELYTRNKMILDNQNNITKYKHRNQFYLHPSIKILKIYKKCSLSINQYCWRIKSDDGSLYYTTTNDEGETLKSILKRSRISELRNQLINDYFKYCLISYVTRENIELMGLLSRGQEINVMDDVKMFTKDYYTMNKTESAEKSPDYTFIYENETYIIDAFDGRDETRISKKIQKFQSSFPGSIVYVFASNVVRLGQRSDKNLRLKFDFKYLNDKKDLESTNVLLIGPLKLDCDEINQKYCVEYESFASQVFYWQRCEKQQVIIQANSSNEAL